MTKYTPTEAEIEAAIREYRIAQWVDRRPESDCVVIALTAAAEARENEK